MILQMVFEPAPIERLLSDASVRNILRLAIQDGVITFGALQSIPPAIRTDPFLKEHLALLLAFVNPTVQITQSSQRLTSRKEHQEKDPEEREKDDGLDWSDSFTFYGREVTKTKRLTREEEVLLAQRIEKGKDELLWIVLRTRDGIKKIHELRQGLSRGNLSIEDVVDCGDEEISQNEEETKQKIVHGLKNVERHLQVFQGGSREREEACQHKVCHILHKLAFRPKHLEEIAETLASGEKKLALRIRKNQEDIAKAKEEFTNANLRLVISMAGYYLNRGLARNDLIQEGNMGLMKAVDKFDWRRGYKFSTYATHWIRQGITRAIADQGSMIRIPVHMKESIGKMWYCIHQLVQQFGREPTPEEIAKRLGVEVGLVKKMLQIVQHTVSLDSPIGDGDNDGRVLADVIPDTKIPTPEAILMEKESNVRVQELISEIKKPRIRRVLELRFGNIPLTLEEIGDLPEFKVTRERIRQMEEKGIRQLRRILCAKRRSKEFGLGDISMTTKR